MATDFFLIRHGQTEWNRDGRMQGHGDSPLTDLGHAQARAIAARLGGLRPDALVCSDLGRARQTAAYTAQVTGLSPAIDPGLRERNLGIFEGLTPAEVQARHPEAYQRWRSQDPAYAMPGGESLLQRTARVLAALGAHALAHPGARIAVITHGGCLDSMIRSVLHIPFDARRGYQLPNAAFNHFQCHEGHWSLLAWGDRAHLVHLNPS